MLIKNVSSIGTSLDKTEFVEFADLYIRLVNAACIVERIGNEKNTEVPLSELKSMGVINTESELTMLSSFLQEKYDDYLAAVNMVVAYRKKLYPYVCRLYNSYRKSEQTKHEKDQYTVADFFCGAGGLSLGFRQSGFKIELANDIEDVCIETYKYNHPEIPDNQVIKGDIKALIDNISEYVTRDIDVMVGGPPCQGFSQANKNHRVIDDPRNKLYKYYLLAIGKIVPKFVVMENVRGMLKVASQVVEDYRALRCEKDGKIYTYDVAFRLFNSEFFSVAQSRERLIYIAVRNDVSESLKITPEDVLKEIDLENKGKPIFTLNDALKDIRPLDAEHFVNHNEIDSETSGKKVMVNDYSHNSNPYLKLINMGRNIPITYNHKARYCSDLNYEIYKRLEQGDDATNDKIKDIMPYAHRNHCFKDKYYKLIAGRPCRTITAHLRMDCHSHIHPYQVRALTPREAARVQSFPDDYVFLGAYLKTYMQIGNAVPPIMARTIAGVIMRHLKDLKTHEDCTANKKTK